MLAALVFTLAQATAAPTIPSADQIFDDAKRVWEERVAPPYVSFEIDCEHTFLAADCSSNDRIEFFVRTSDGRSYAQTLPGQGAAPKVLFRGGYITGPADTPLGFYRAVTNGKSPASTPPNMAPDPLRTIVSVKASGHVYDVTLAGEAVIDGRLCYHLLLHPEIDPDLYPLRALWVEESSSEIVQLIYERPYVTGSRVIVWFRFAPVGPEHVWTVVHIDAQATTQRIADDLSDIAFPANAPDSYFEPEKN